MKGKDEEERNKGDVHTRSGAGRSSSVVACSLCPLQKKKTLQHRVSPPPQFADQ